MKPTKWTYRRDYSTDRTIILQWFSGHMHFLHLSLDKAVNRDSYHDVFYNFALSTQILRYAYVDHALKLLSAYFDDIVLDISSPRGISHTNCITPFTFQKIRPVHCSCTFYKAKLQEKQSVLRHCRLKKADSFVSHAAFSENLVLLTRTYYLREFVMNAGEYYSPPFLPPPLTNTYSGQVRRTVELMTSANSLLENHQAGSYSHLVNYHNNTLLRH